MEPKQKSKHTKCYKPNVVWVTSPWVDNKLPTEDYVAITNKELDKQADQYEKERKL